MARKEKIIIRDEELIPTTIGFIDNKQIGLLYLTFIFIVLILFVIFIPEISVYLNEFTKSNDIVETEEMDQEQDLSYINGMSIIKDDVTLSNIILEDKQLSFTIVNTSNTSLNLTNDNMYLELYNSYDNLIARTDFSNINILVGGTYLYTIDILSSDLNYFKFESYTESDYPEVELTLDEDGIQNLVCIKGDEIITYEFSSKLLKNYTSKTFVSNPVEYEELLLSYNNITGISAVLEQEFENYFMYTINLSLYNDDLEDEKIYGINTKAKNINFEMISKGYDCN